MTLSRFLRDFLYIPLGGNRGGRWRTYRNLMITMALGGLWHGAAWTFVLWGVFHGAGLVTEHALGGRIKLPGWLRWLVTFHLIIFGWILFRSENLHAVGTFLSRLVTPGPATLYTVPVVGVIVAAIGLQLLPARPIARPELWFGRLRPAVLGAGLAVLIIVAGATVSSQGVAPFIYFRF